MTRINALRTNTSSVAWGKNVSALVFAAVLIICSVTVGCSSEKPKPVSSVNSDTHSPVAQAPAPIAQPEPAALKPAPKKIVHKKPATVNYADKTYGLTFEYPRRYAIETGSAATDLLVASPIPMNFVQPGGVALAAVELPETGFANTDFSSAFFNVSVNKTLTADQCAEFAVPQPKGTPAIATTAASADPTPKASGSSDSVSTESVSKSDSSAVSQQVVAPQPAPEPKLMLGDLLLRATEAVSGEGTRQSDSKYFHVFQNGACYEFTQNVTTVASADGVTKHIDRDKVFDRLQKIMATVKISPVNAPEVASEVPTPTPITPAQ
jgi:hypothetical protein